LLKWVFANELDLVFVAVYLDLSHLSYVDNLLEIVKKEFIAAFKDGIAECQPPFKFDARFEAILDKFEQKDLEDKAAKVTRKVPRSFAESRKSSGVAGVLKMMGRAIKSSAAAASAASSGALDDDADADGEGDDAESEAQPAPEADGGARATKQQEEPKVVRAAAAETTESADDQAERVAPSAAATSTPSKAAVGTDAASTSEDPDDTTTSTSSSSSSGEFKVNADKLRQLAAMRGGRGGRPGSMVKRSPSVVSPPPAAASSTASAGKEKTQWANRKLSAAEMKSLDYSSSSSSSAADGDDIGARSAAYGAAKVDKKVFEYDDEDEKEVDISVETEAKEKKGTLFGWFEHLSGNKVLDKDDLDPVLENMRQALMTKNVAAEIAAKLCGSVTESLIGKKIGSFSTVRSVAKQAMEEALLRILTPRRPVDMLHGVQTAKENGRPYSVVFCGVNGVGKSTSLAKITNFLQAHSFKVRSCVFPHTSNRRFTNASSCVSPTCALFFIRDQFVVFLFLCLLPPPLVHV
jgi:signal recognition particle receptor subunit alpha